MPFLSTLTHEQPNYHSAEKWFYWLVARTFAKACESLGIRKATFPVNTNPTLPRSWDMVLWDIVSTGIQS
jgi:hypothetical protein